MTIADESATAHRRTTGVVRLLLAVASLGAVAWGTWLQPVKDYYRTDSWSDRLLHPVWSNPSGAGYAESVALSADGRIAIVRAQGRLFRTEDGGARWAVLPTPSSIWPWRSAALSGDGRHVIAVGWNRSRQVRVILLSQDGGATWAVHDFGEGFGGMSHVALSADGMRGLIAGFGEKSEGSLLRTSDGGRTWSAHDGPYDPVALAADGLHAITTGGHRVRRTTDGGATWTAHPLSGDYASAMSVTLSADGRVGYAVGTVGLRAGRELRYQGSIWRTEDGGRHGQLLPPSISVASNAW